MARQSSDFSYAYYRRLVSSAQEFLAPCLFRDVPSLAPAGRYLLLRHDVDCCLKAAVRFGAMEAEAGVQSTYFVMMQSLLYDVAESRAVHDLAAMGHEVGVHFDCPPEQDVHERVGVEARVDDDCRRLEDILGAPVTSVSFHRPVAAFLNGPLMLAGRVNAYAAELMSWYVSDSRGAWRCGNPLLEIGQERHSTLQLLTHPIWWGERHLPAADRLQEFFRASTSSMSVRQRAIFDAILSATVPGIRRNGLHDPAAEERPRTIGRVRDHSTFMANGNSS